MNEWWALVLVFLVGFGLPGAFCFGVQVGRERQAQEDWERLMETDPYQ